MSEEFDSRYSWETGCDRLAGLHSTKARYDDSDEKRVSLQGDDVLFIGGFDDLDASYSHSTHLFYISNDGWIYTYSSGCSCWDDDNGRTEWEGRKTFKTRQEFMDFFETDFKKFKEYDKAIEAISKINKKTVVLANKNPLRGIEQGTFLQEEGIL